MCLIGPGPPSKIMANRRIAEIPGAHAPVMSCGQRRCEQIGFRGRWPGGHGQIIANSSLIGLCWTPLIQTHTHPQGEWSATAHTAKANCEWRTHTFTQRVPSPLLALRVGRRWLCCVVAVVVVGRMRNELAAGTGMAKRAGKPRDSTSSMQRSVCQIRRK